MNHERITINPEIMLGKPVVKGTRIPVERILRKLSAGHSPEQIVQEHPRLTVEDIHAATRFAADYMAREDIILADGARL